MASREHPKMSVENRAKQFLPFSALKGLNEALAEKERITVPKTELMAEMQDELNEKLIQIKKGDIVTVIHFCDDEYLKTTGVVTEIDDVFKRLRIVNKYIMFEDLYKVELQEV